MSTIGKSVKCHHRDVGKYLVVKRLQEWSIGQQSTKKTIVHLLQRFGQI